MNDVLEISGSDLTLTDFVNVVRNAKKVQIAAAAIPVIQEGRKRVETILAEKKIAYGINTGFGSLCDSIISPNELSQLQLNLIKSHACGMGEPFPVEVVRGMLLLRGNSLINEVSGARLETIQFLIDLLNNEIHPIVPEHGSLGASGDLIPLAHMALVLLGLGEVEVNGKRLDGKSGLKEVGLTPISLEAKEGLALINGTAVSTALTALALYDSKNLAFIADATCALTLEALCGDTAPFSKEIHKRRQYIGQGESAKQILKLIGGSTLVDSHQHVQDPYSVRCVPQVHGASRDAISYAESIIKIELNAVTDNPFIIRQGDTFDAISGGNFHGQPIALTADFLCMAISEFGSISERRIERLLNPQLSRLPPFLVENSGLNSGFMISQYLAAALVSDNKLSSHPACVDSIPVSASQEDHVSLSVHAARKLRRILTNVERILAIELLIAAQGIDFREEGKEKLGKGTKIIYQTIRDLVPPLDADRELHKDFAKIENLIHSGLLTKNLKGYML